MLWIWFTIFPSLLPMIRINRAMNSSNYWPKRLLSRNRLVQPNLLATKRNPLRRIQLVDAHSMKTKITRLSDASLDPLNRPMGKNEFVFFSIENISVVRCATSPKAPKKIISSTRTVTLVSNRTSTTNQPPNVQSPTDESPQDKGDEPAWKRAKIDSNSPLAENVNRNKSGTTATDDHDYRRALEERRTIASASSIVPVPESTPKKSSTSRSPSTSKGHRHADEHRRRRSPSHSHQSSTNRSSRQSNHRSKDNSRPSSSSAHRSSVLSDRPRKPNLSPRRPDRRRSSDSNHRYPLSNATDLTDRQPILPETSCRSSLSSSYRSRPMNDLIVPGIEQRSTAANEPVRHKRFNYNHQSVADHPRFANPAALAPSTPSTDFDYARLSANNYRSTPPVKLRNRKWEFSTVVSFCQLS